MVGLAHIGHMLRRYPMRERRTLAGGTPPRPKPCHCRREAANLMTEHVPITAEAADSLLIEVYGVDWYDGDRDWWVEMIDALMDKGTVDAARAWLKSTSE